MEYAEQFPDNPPMLPFNARVDILEPVHFGVDKECSPSYERAREFLVEKVVGYYTVGEDAIFRKLKENPGNYRSECIIVEDNLEALEPLLRENEPTNSTMIRIVDMFGDNYYAVCNKNGLMSLAGKSAINEWIRLERKYAA